MKTNKKWTTFRKILTCVEAACEIALCVVLLVDRKNASTKKTDERSVTE